MSRLQNYGREFGRAASLLANRIKDMRYTTIITIVLLGFELLLGAQDRQEGLLLLTDRGHYISGETIHYRAFYMEPGESGQTSWSKILYVELILPNGTPLAQGKVSIDTAGAIGTIVGGVPAHQRFVISLGHFCGHDFKGLS